jgi:hypothetical protein
VALKWSNKAWWRPRFALAVRTPDNRPDLLRGCAVRGTEPIEAAVDVADQANPDRRDADAPEAIKTGRVALCRTPAMQRSVVI